MQLYPLKNMIVTIILHWIASFIIFYDSGSIFNKEWDGLNGFTSTSEIPGTVPAKHSPLHDQNNGCLFRCDEFYTIALDIFV